MVQVSDLLHRRSPLGGEDALRSALRSAAPALLFGLRLSVSVCLALVVAFWLQLESPSWAATSAGIVAQPTLGASLRKGRFRAIGTVIGGIAAVVLAAVFPQERVGFLTGLTLWAAGCGYLATILPTFVGYAAALAGYTTAIIFAGIADNPENVFLMTVWRVTEIVIGIVSAQLVQVLTDFGDARGRLAKAMMEIGKSITSGLAATLRARKETLQSRTSRRALIGRAIALDGTVEEAIEESAELQEQRGRLWRALGALFAALSSWRGIGNHLDVGSPSSNAAQVSVLLPPIVRLTQEDWQADPSNVRALCERESRLLREWEAVDLSSRLFRESALRVFRAMQVVADALIVLRGADDEPVVRATRRWYVPDHVPGFVNALRIVLALGTAELIWIATSWPDGPTMITFTALNVILAARQSESTYAWAMEFTIGCVIAGGFAWLAAFAILPTIHGGALALSLALTAVLLPLGALAAGSWHKTVFVAAVTNFMPILALENEPTYDAALLFNATLAVAAGTATAALFLRLLPPLPPRRRIARMLWLTLQDLRKLACGSRRYRPQAWRDLVSARLAALPPQATLEQQAQLLAMFSVGEAASALRAARSTCRCGDMLGRAFAHLAEGCVAESRASFVRFAECQLELRSTDEREVDVAVHASLIADALLRHEGFFGTIARHGQ